MIIIKDMKHLIIVMFVLFIFLLFFVVCDCKYLNDPKYIIIGEVEEVRSLFLNSFIEFKPITEIDNSPNEKMYADITAYSLMYNIKIGKSIKIRCITSESGCVIKYLVCPTMREGIISFIIFFAILVIPTTIMGIDCTLNKREY